MAVSVTWTMQNKDKLHAALVSKVGKIEAAGIYGLSQVAFAIEAEAKKNIQGTHKRGTPRVGNATGGPNNVTGALRRSIHTEIRKGFGVYAASVFPTMVYSRALELGLRNGARYPYLMPAARSIKPKANQIFRAAIMRRMRG